MLHNNQALKITIVGGGYVGLSQACLFAQRHEVILLDIDENKVAMINQGIAPIAEKKIKEFLKNEQIQLTATTDEKAAYSDADIVVIAVPTNFDEDNNFFDVSLVEQTVRSTLSYDQQALIVIKSTIPIGFTEQIRKETSYDRILFCPEFLREGKALEDGLCPSRIIVGAEMSDSQSVKDAELFAEIVKQCCNDPDCSIEIMSNSEAEAVKLFSNTYLALRVAFFNELDTYAERMDLDTGKIITAMGMDPRIGTHYNNPGFGYGGYCLPKDTQQLRAQFDAIPQKLITATIESNSTRMDYIAQQIMQRADAVRSANGDQQITIGFYRINMKKDSDNYRQSAVVEILKRVADRGYSVEVYEPLLKENDEFLADCRVVNDLEQFKKDCPIIVANRVDDCLADVREHVYTRDIFKKN